MLEILKEKCDLIPVGEIEITYDSEKTTGYDFTVKDNYTFSTYDGVFVQDTMGIYAMLSEESQNEIKNKLISAISFEKIGGENFQLNQEMYTGLFTLTYKENGGTRKNIKSVEDAWELHIYNPVIFQNIKTTAGRVIFNNCLPKDYPFVNEEITKKKVNKILSDLIEKDQNTYVKTIDCLMKLSFRIATIYPKTICLEDLELNKTLMDLKTELANTKGFTEQTMVLTKMETEMLKLLKEKDSGMYYHIVSGASKGPNQMRQALIAKGIIEDPSGNILPPSSTAIGEGFKPEEYFNISAGGRKGTISRSIGTAEGGYLYRILVYVIGNVEGDVNNADCGTRNYLRIKLTDNIFKRMRGRYKVENKKILPITKNDVGKVIDIRSPIFCKSEKICRTCYGDLLNIIKTPNIGILSAQYVGSFAEKIMKCVNGLVYVNNNFYSMEEIFNNDYKNGI